MEKIHDRRGDGKSLIYIYVRKNAELYNKLSLRLCEAGRENYACT